MLHDVLNVIVDSNPDEIYHLAALHVSSEECNQDVEKRHLKEAL